MNLPVITVFLALVPLVWIFLVLWREKAHYHSLIPYIIGASLITIARLLDVPIEIPSLQWTGLLGFSKPVVDTVVITIGDTADIIGVSFLVAGFTQTIRSLRIVEKQVQTLESLLPMCSWCKRIRDTGDCWGSIENYITKHGGPEVTHGICPDCATKLKNDYRKSKQDGNV